MSSGFVTSEELEEQRKKRQEEWERVRKPEDPVQAPEPEVCNKSLYEQLRDNKEAKQAEIDEAKKFKNMLRGIDEDESDFLARVNELKSAELRKAKKEEEEAIREAALARSKQNLVEPLSVSQLKVLPKDDKPQKSKQAALLSTAIKRKSDSASSDSEDEEDPYIPVLQTTRPQKKDESLKLLRDESVNKMFRPRILDLACGKGGDLRKWKIANVDSVVMADVAQVSLNQAKERYDEMAQRERNGLFPVEFVHADCSKESLKAKMVGVPEFDLVSCQFALHYSFIDEESARTFLRNATETLRPGGFFIGTLPDADRIVWSARENDGEFRNEVCSVRYENKEELAQPPLFGAMFHFTLDSQVNCPEFLAYFPLVEQ
ncbi:mRNA capping enzyme large subunit [Trichostrongylus colubriformis]|uniref:mRNA (guanine-N(7))-methyltransferase n=1 Tax=Trichostrongylus colubriformis TaxID=6319 RepID=A0AAN8EV76_TRICO